MPRAAGHPLFKKMPYFTYKIWHNPYNGCIFSLFVILIPFIYFFGYFIAALCLPLFYELVEI